MNIQHIIFGVDPPNLEHKEQMPELKLFTKLFGFFFWSFQVSFGTFSPKAVM